MPQAIPVIAAVSGAVGIAGTVMAHNQQKKASKAAEQQQLLQDRRQRMQAIRSAQIQRASAIMSSIGAGSSESSGAMGGIGSIGSQLGTELGFGSQMSNLSGDINRANRSASMWSGVAGLGMTGFNMAGGPEALAANFGGGRTPMPSFQGYQVPNSSSVRPRPNPFY